MNMIKKFLGHPVIKNFTLFAGSALLARSVLVLLTPITMSMLLPADYGLLGLFGAFFHVTVIFLGLGLRQAFGIEFFHKDSTQRRVMVNDIILVYLFISVPVLLTLYANAHTLNQLIFVGTATRSMLAVSLLNCFLYFFAELFYQILRYQSRALKLTLINGATVVAAIVSYAIFFLHCKLGVLGVLVSGLCTTVTGCVFGLFDYVKTNCFAHRNFKKTRQALRGYLKIGLPFIGSLLCSKLLASGDRWVLAQYASLHDVGIYSIANACGEAFQLGILVPLSGSYIPYLLSTFGTNKDKLLEIDRWNFKMMWYTMVCTALLITVGLPIIKPVLCMIMPAQYHEALNYVWLILMGYVFLLGTYFSSALMQFCKRTYMVPLSLAFPTLLNIALNLALVQRYRIYGCAFATLVCYAVYFIITVWYNRRLRHQLTQKKHPE